MRTLDTISHPQMYIAIMYMNEKFVVKFEIGPYEQVYKFTKEMAADVDAVKKLIDSEFQSDVMALFDKMHEGLKKKFS